MIEATIITELSARGITLLAEGGRIRARGQLDDNTRALIRTHKAQLLAALTGKRELPEQPYRINLDGHAHVIWLEPGLAPAAVVAQARQRYGPGRIAEPAIMPANGWPTLGEIPAIATRDSQMPTSPCACGSRHYWQDTDPWRCSACDPLPTGFVGETCTVPGPATPPVTTITREHLERIHPPTVAGLPLTAILEQADPADYPDLADPARLAAFAQALITSATVDPRAGVIGPRYRTAVQDGIVFASPEPVPPPPRVRCSTCQHVILNPTNPEQGVSRCRVDSPARRRPSPYPKVERYCAAWRAKP